MALIGQFKEDLELYLAENKGRTGASKQSQMDIHKKLWHSNYTYTECPKCKQRFETITDMNNSKDHKQHCVVWQAGNVLVSVKG